MDEAPGAGRHFGGGAQNNGTLVPTDGRSHTHFEILGGDGGWMIYDPTDAGHIYASYYHMNIWHWRNGRRGDVSPPASQKEKNSVWMACLAMDPRDRKTVFTGAKRV